MSVTRHSVGTLRHCRVHRLDHCARLSSRGDLDQGLTGFLISGTPQKLDIHVLISS